MSVLLKSVINFMIDQSTWSINYNAILILFRDLSPEFLKGIDPEIIVEYFENASPTDLKESKQTNQNFSFSCQLFTLKKNMFESILVNFYMQGGQNVRIVRIIRIFYFVTLKLYGLLSWKYTGFLNIHSFQQIFMKISKKILVKMKLV